MDSKITGKAYIYTKEIEKANGDKAVIYSTALSKKQMDGTYDRGYIGVQFKKGVEVPNKAEIDIKNGWLSFYKNKDNQTIPIIFISEYELVQQEEVDESNLPF
jgi:hypothetical protein